MIRSKAPELEGYWNQILDLIKQHHGVDTFNYFFADTMIYEVIGNQMWIFASTNLAKNIIDSRYKTEIENLIIGVFQTEFSIKIITKDEIPASNPIVIKPKEASYFPNSRLKPEYQFSNFVIGETNKEASQAALMMTSIKNRLYNPLFIYSDSGLGKTHLLNAIGNYIKENSPNLNVLYISSNDFVSECINYFKDKENYDHNKFRNFFKTVDVLLVDDVQMFQKHLAVEDMFFAIFEDMTNENKAIILASDRHPGDLKDLHPRLITRFGSGLNVNILKPDVSLGVQILKSKIRNSGRDESKFDLDALEYMAANHNNIRELEAVLNRVIFCSIMSSFTQNDRFTLEFVQSSIDKAASKTQKGIIDEKRIISEVADFYNLSPSQLSGKSRVLQIALARHVAMYLIRVMLDTSLAEIGRYFGGVHHTTVMNGIEKVENMCKTDNEAKKVITTLKAKIKQK